MSKSGSIMLLVMLVSIGLLLTGASWTIYNNINKLNTCKPDLKRCNQGVFMIGIILLTVPLSMGYCGCLPDNDEISTSIVISLFAALGLVLLVLGSIIRKNKVGCGKITELSNFILVLGLCLFAINVIILITNNYDYIKAKFSETKLTDAQKQAKAKAVEDRRKTREAKENASKLAKDTERLQRDALETTKRTDQLKKARELEAKNNLALQDAIIDESAASMKNQQATQQLSKAQQMALDSAKKLVENKDKGTGDVSVASRAAALSGSFKPFGN